MRWVDYEAAAIGAGVTVRTIRRWVQQGHLVSKHGMVSLDAIERHKAKVRRVRMRLTECPPRRAMLARVARLDSF